MLCIEFDICIQFVIPHVISDAGLHAARGVMTTGISDWLCVNPTFGYERDAVENWFLGCEAVFTDSLARCLAVLCLLKAKWKSFEVILHTP